LKPNPGINPIIVADSIKFVTFFRRQICSNPSDTKSLLELVAPFLSVNSFVVRTYAANAIDKIFSMIKHSSDAASVESIVSSHAADFIRLLFNALKFKDEDFALENEYVAKVILRICWILKEGCASLASDILSEVIAILKLESKNPQNAEFIHSMFNIVACCVRYVVAGNKAALPVLEKILIPVLQEFLVNNITDFIPYSIQIFSQMLDLSTPGSLNDAYNKLFTSFLNPALWESEGTVPAARRYLQAYITHAPSTFVSSPEFGTVLNIFQSLTMSPVHVLEGFELITTIMQTFSVDVLNGIMPTVFKIIFTRMGSTRMPKVYRAYDIFICRAILQHGFANIRKWTDAVEAGVFEKTIISFVCPNIRVILSPLDRRLFVATFCWLCTRFTDLLQGPNPSSWAKIVEQLISLVDVMSSISSSELDQKEAWDDVMRVTTSGTTFSPLSFIEKKSNDVPLLQKNGIPLDFASIKSYFVQGLQTIVPPNRTAFSALFQQTLTPKSLEKVQKFFFTNQIAL